MRFPSCRPGREKARPMSEHDLLILAPMHGVTLRFLRNALARRFKAPELAVSPFISTVAGGKINSSLLDDVDLSREQRMRIVPQVIGKNPDDLRVMIRVLKAMGHDRVDLNAGCPWPMVAKKGRGAGLAKNRDNLTAMLEAGCSELPDGFSVKLRLGFERTDEILELMPILNSFPLVEVCLHARTARQMYEGNVELDAFEAAAGVCKHPIVYNGDIFTAEIFIGLQRRFPQIKRWMIGRGLLRNPFLMEEIIGGGETKYDLNRIRNFAADCMDACLGELSGPAAATGRMKEIWSYLCCGMPGNLGARLWRRLKLCRTPQEMDMVLDSTLR